MLITKLLSMFGCKGTPKSGKVSGEAVINVKAKVSHKGSRERKVVYG